MTIQKEKKLYIKFSKCIYLLFKVSFLGCNGTKKKKKKKQVVGRAENSGDRWHTTHKGRPRAGMPHIADLQPPWKNLQRNENGEEKGERTENRRNSGKAEPYESTSKTPILHHKNNPRTFYTHQE